MPKILKIGVSQSYTLPTLKETLAALESSTKRAASLGISVLLFPEAYLGGYPRTCDFGATVGARQDRGREQFLQYFRSAVDLGDTPAGAGERWLSRDLPVARDAEYRGDGTREYLERVAQQTGVLIVTGLIERAGGSLYCGVVYVDPIRGVLGKRRKVLPTGSERLVWARGSASTLKAVTTTIKDVKLTLAAAICWENVMPLLRQSLYAQNVNLYLAPTADFKPTWLPLMQSVGLESRAFVLSANMCHRRKHLPSWITGKTEEGASVTDALDTQTNTAARRRTSVTTRTADNHEITWPAPPGTQKDNEAAVDASSSKPIRPPSTRSKSYNAVIVDEEEDEDKAHEIALPKTNGGSTETTKTETEAEPPPQPSLNTRAIEDTDSEEIICRGGSCIISPMGAVLAGPLWDVEEGGLLSVEVDFEDCERGRLDLDLAGSYARPDAFRLEVEGLELEPPP